jgi:hypothetical protein
MAPRSSYPPEARPTEKEITVDTTKDSADRCTGQDEKRLAELMDRYRHALLDDEQRQEVRDRVLRLRREPREEP